MEDESRIERIFQGDIPRTWAKNSTSLDPRKAVTITYCELHELADVASERGDEEFAERLVYVPFIPTNAQEARAMMSLLNMANGVKFYAGYTMDELKVIGGAQIEVSVGPAYRRDH